MELKNKLTARLLMSTALCAIAATAAPAAVAQDEDGDDSNDRRLEQVVVTSTKRTTALQDAPISVGVVPGEVIAEYNITDLTDLQGFVPSLVVQKTFGNWAVRVRGLGSGVTNIAFDSSVSIFNDGIYCGRSRCLETGFFDVQNVEIARGPQGALFGKSTIAGAITVASARPTNTFESYVTAGAELENGGFRTTGAVSGPIAKNLSGRFALQYQDLEGDMENRFTGQKDNSVESLAMRGSLLWDIGPDTEFWAKVESGWTDVLGRRNQLAGPGALASPTAPIDPATLETIVNDVRYVSTGTSSEDFDYSDQFGVTASFDTGLGDHTLSLIGGYWALRYNNLLDVDGVPEALLNSSLYEDYEQTSFEGRILSPTGGTFEYIAGAMYHNSLTKTGQFSQFYPGFYETVGVPPAFTASIPGAVGVVRDFKRDSETLSAYGQLTWNITDRLSLIGDLRYTEETQDARGLAYQVTFPDGETPVRTPNAPFQAGSPDYIFYQVREDESLDPSLRVLYELTPDINVYAAYSTGSKPGGLKANDGGLGRVLLGRDSTFLQRYVGTPTLTTADIAGGVTLRQGNGVFDFEGEDAENIEIGTKMVLADGRVNFNATAFRMEFDNLQTSSYDGTQFIIGNAASAEVSGLELEGRWMATDNLTLNGSAALLDATYKKYQNAQCPIGPDGNREDPSCIDGQGDLSGRRLERAPEVELNLGGAWEGQVSQNLFLTANVDMYYSGDFYVRQDFDPDGRQDAFTKWNARFGLGPQDGGWEVALVGRNLTDERTIQHAYEVLSPFQAVGAGRSVFLETTFRW